jgi:nitrite reductase (NADH) large subunit
MLHERIVEHGVAVHTRTRTNGVERDSHGAMRILAGGLEPFAVDLVIVATGVRPNDGLLAEALEPGRPGIPVAATMETVVDGVFAAGDVARGPTVAGGPREIHALWPTAVEQGRVAGANLAGAGVVYGGSLSMNVTEMFGVTVGSLGRIVEDQGDDVVVRSDLAGIDHLKVVSRAGVPVGALVIGGHEGAVLLGRLRSYVRERRLLTDVRDLIDRRDLDRKLAGAGALRRAGSRLEAPKEEASCVS